MSLRARFLTLFALLGVVPILALGIFGYVRSLQAVESLLQGETGAIAQRLASDIQDRYALRASELLLVADNAETQELYRAHAAGTDGPASKAFTNADTYLTSAWDFFGASYHGIELRDSAGASLYALGNPGGGRPGSATTDQPPPSGAVELRFPVIRAEDSDTVGVVVGSVRTGAILFDELLGSTFGRAGYTALLDRGAGAVLRHPSRRFLHQSTEQLLSETGWNVDAATLAADSGSFTYRENDSLRVASFVKLSSPAWTVVASAAVDEFAPPFLRTRNVDLLVMLLVAAAIALSFLLMTYRATASLEQLTVAADDVARGELSPQLPKGGEDEVGRLARAFGLMVEEVRRMLARVEETRHMAVMGEFASRVSHEIRNPLTSIKLNLQELGRDVEQGRIPQDSEPPVRICLREVERLDRAVSRVLSMARTHPPATLSCSLHGILADATEAVAPQLRSEHVAVEHRFEATRDTVRGDPRDLEGVFVNLLVNACEAMPGGGRIRICTGNTNAPSASKGTIRVRVSDEGSGVPADIREQIFRPFVSTKEEGTGFGLAVARRTVEEHGGRIDLERGPSDAGGATFVVELPLAEADVPLTEAR